MMCQLPLNDSLFFFLYVYRLFKCSYSFGVGYTGFIHIVSMHREPERLAYSYFTMHVYLILASGTQFRITDFRIGLGFASNAAGFLCISYSFGVGYTGFIHIVSMHREPERLAYSYFTRSR
jgi:phosphoribosylcarboxyaminoimidazole (NCAIR) mutase